MTQSVAAPERQRDATKEKHRRALIDATADVILDHGLAQVSVSRILDRAGLSRGMINLHFQSKNNLLLEVLRQASEDYVAHWKAALDQAGSAPEDRLGAVIAADFDPAVLNRRMMAIWIAFRGDAAARVEYLPFIDSRDTRIHSELIAICTELCAAGPYPGVQPKLAAHALTAALEGLWNDFHLYPERFDRDEARAVVLHMARAFFPRHFA